MMASPSAGGQPVRVFCFGDCSLNASTRELRRGDGLVRLRRQVFDLLLLLIQRHPMTVSLAEIRKAVWRRHDVASGSVARAVLEARRAIGDPTDAPRVIVNVHGVGYRFAASLRPEADGGEPGATAASALLAKVQSHLQQVEAAYQRRSDPALMVAHAEQALALAMRHGLNVEAGKALCWLAWHAMAADKLDDAAQHAGHALHLAVREGHDLLRARARLVDGAIHLSLGNMGHAMAQLNAAYPVLVADSQPLYRHQCETMLSRGAMYLDDLPTAVHWCVEAQKSAAVGGLTALGQLAVGNQAAMEQVQGDQLELAGHIDQACKLWQTALDRVDQLLAVMDVGIDDWVRAACLGNRGQLLGRLGRLAEARAALQGVEDWLNSQHQQPSASWDARIDLWIERANLCLREGDPMQALQAVRSGLQTAEAQHYSGPLRPALYQLASSVAERCGELALALQWSRHHHERHVAQTSGRAQVLAGIIRTQAQHDAVSEELSATRARVVYLERMNAQLLMRTHKAAGSTEPLGQAALPDAH